jgi:hypothetical protein
MSTRNLATTAGWVIGVTACTVAGLTAWLMVTSPTTVAVAFYEAFAHLVRYL